MRSVETGRKILEPMQSRQPIATSGDIALKTPTNGQLLLPAPPATRSSRAATILHDRWNALRNDLRLVVEDHMVAAPIITLAAGFIAGRLLNAALTRHSGQGE